MGKINNIILNMIDKAPNTMIKCLIEFDPKHPGFVRDKNYMRDQFDKFGSMILSEVAEKITVSTSAFVCKTIEDDCMSLVKIDVIP